MSGSSPNAFQIAIRTSFCSTISLGRSLQSANCRGRNAFSSAGSGLEASIDSYRFWRRFRQYILASFSTNTHRPLLELVQLVQLRQPRKNVEHGLLDRFLGIFLVTENRVGQNERPALVRPNQFMKEFAFSSKDPRDEQPFRRSSLFDLLGVLFHWQDHARALKVTILEDDNRYKDGSHGACCAESRVC